MQDLLDIFNSPNKEFNKARWATIEEVNIIFDLIQERQVKTYIEIGTANGWSTAWALSALQSDGIAHTIDVVKRPLIKEVEEDPRLIRHIGDSKDNISSILKGCVGKKLLFIDGDHSYTGVLADYTAVKSHLNEGDLILFHDTSGERRIGRFIQRNIDNNACFKVSSFDTRNGMVLGEVINEV